MPRVASKRKGDENIPLDDHEEEEQDSGSDVDEAPPKRGRKAKKEPKKGKDPAMPKRPLSSYLLFCEDTRPSVKKDNPDMKVTEIMKELSNQWRNLSDGEKQKYIDKAAEGKKKYEELKKGILKKGK